MEKRVQFDDGLAYERMMGTWSRLAGEVFLDWLAPPPGRQCLDVGCGNGAFTELLVDRCAPAEVQGIDPAPAQIEFARQRLGPGVAEFRQGDALALPFPDARFDVAIMALVIFFVSDPPKGVAEMARVVRPGGVVAAYAWDMTGGGSPVDPLQQELIAVGQRAARAPMAAASRIEALREMWANAGLERIETRTIEVRRTFASFEELWTVTLAGTGLGQTIAAMAPADVETVKARVRAKLPADAEGRVSYGATANAVKGHVPR